MSSPFHRIVIAVLGIIALATSVAAQPPASEPFPGVNKYWRIDSTASTGGIMTMPTEAAAELKKRGFKAVINLAGGTTGAAEKAAVEATGLRYFEIVFNPQTMDPAPLGPFLKAASDPSNQPVFVHSGNGHRAAALWLIKRVVVDGWSMEKAGVEAAAAGLVNDNTTASQLWRFAYDYTTAAATAAQGRQR